MIAGKSVLYSPAARISVSEDRPQQDWSAILILLLQGTEHWPSNQLVVDKVLSLIPRKERKAVAMCDKPMPTKPEPTKSYSTQGFRLAAKFKMCTPLARHD